MKKVLKEMAAASLVLTLAACGSSETAAASSSGDAAYRVGICQLVQHEALDSATQGFKDALTEEFGDAVSFDEQNASGDSATCSTIVNQFVTDDVDLILANATASLQAAAAATDSIPVLGTSITEYGTALDIDDFNGTVGNNISGTSDLAPLEDQAAMFDELLPDAKTIGILYCSAEPNSLYQAKVVQEALEANGKKVVVSTFADSNDVASVTQALCSEVDAIYIPTDNTAASSAELIDNIASQSNTPIIAGEEGIAKKCGIAALTISYYELGKTTGAMAVKILKGEADVSEMAIEYDANPVKKYNAEKCEALGITVPSDYTAMETE